MALPPHISTRDLAEWIGRHVVVYPGNPSGVVIAGPGTICLDETDGATTNMWLKKTGTDSSGWTAIA